MSSNPYDPTYAEFDFRDLVHRIDPRFGPAPLVAVPEPRVFVRNVTGLGAVQAGQLTATTVLLADGLRSAGTDTITSERMLGVWLGFCDYAGDRQVSAWSDVSADLVSAFLAVRDGQDAPSPDTRRLRKNVLRAGWLTHSSHVLGLEDVTAGVRPVQGEVRDDLRGRQVGPAALHRSTADGPRKPVPTRTATHDGVTLMRLAVPHAATRSTAHTPGAALSLLANGATTREAPQVLVAALLGEGVDAQTRKGQLTPSDLRPEVAFPGHHLKDGSRLDSPRPRTGRPSDRWEQRALLDRLEEMRRARRAGADESALYGQAVGRDGNSAQVVADRHLRKLTIAADLDQEPGLTATSFRFWGVLRDVTDHAGAVRASRHFGSPVLTLVRQVRHMGDRN